MAIRCTISKAGVVNEYGQALAIGTVYTPNNDDYALALISQGKATDTDDFLEERVNAPFDEVVYPIFPDDFSPVGLSADGTSLVAGDRNYELGAEINPYLQSSEPSFLSKAVYYKTNEVSGTTISDSLGNGPSLSIGGVTSGIWANPGWITYHSAGNTIQAVGNTYIDSLFSMVGFGGSIIIAIDYWYGTIPTTTEALFAIWRTQGAVGGFRIARSGGTGVLGAYWTAPGPSSEAGVTFSSDATLLNQRNTLVCELDFSQYAKTARVNVYAYRNGLEVRAGDYASATLPPVEAVGGMAIGCNFVNGAFAGKFGSNNGTGQRLGRFFAMRQEKRNPLVAQYLALWFADGNTELPQSIRSM